MENLQKMGHAANHNPRHARKPRRGNKHDNAPDSMRVGGAFAFKAIG